MLGCFYITCIVFLHKDLFVVIISYPSIRTDLMDRICVYSTSHCQLIPFTGAIGKTWPEFCLKYKQNELTLLTESEETKVLMVRAPVNRLHPGPVLGKLQGLLSHQPISSQCLATAKDSLKRVTRSNVALYVFSATIEFWPYFTNNTFKYCKEERYKQEQ